MQFVNVDIVFKQFVNFQLLSFAVCAKKVEIPVDRLRSSQPNMLIVKC